MHIKGTYLNIIRTIYDKPTASAMVENGKPFSKIRNKARVPSSPVLFSIVIGVLARAIRQDKEINGIQIGKEEKNIDLICR